MGISHPVQELVDIWVLVAGNAMFGYWNLLYLRVDLDTAWAKDISLEIEEAQPRLDPSTNEPHWHSCLAWFTALLRFALTRGAWAIVLRSDAQSGSLRQGIHVGGDSSRHLGFLELVPMSPQGRNSGILTVRLLGGMIFGRKRGTVHYLYEKRRRQAACLVLGDDLTILLASGANWDR